MNDVPLPAAELDELTWQRAIERYSRLTLFLRWVVVADCWFFLGGWSLWQLRQGIALAWDDFTWAAIRYALIFHPLATLALAFCWGLTAAVLVRHSLILWGQRSPKELYRLRQKVAAIRDRGPKDWRWRWVWGAIGPHHSP